MNLQERTLGVALAENERRVTERGGDNRGPAIRTYLQGVDPPIDVAAPWCAAFVQYCADVACGDANPLNDVRQEALVQSYWNWADASGRRGPEEYLFVDQDSVQPGDLVLFQFNGSARWNHMGLVLDPPGDYGEFTTIEGNTHGEGESGPDGVRYRVRSSSASYPVCFVRWAP